MILVQLKEIKRHIPGAGGRGIGSISANKQYYICIDHSAFKTFVKVFKVSAM